LDNVAVVILNFNGEKLLRQFLPSVILNSGSSRIVVADNGSTDNSVQYVRSNFPGIEIILFSKNLGFCGGYNEALKNVNAEYYVLLNSDVEVTKDWLSPLTGLLDSNPRVAAVQPKILSYRQREFFEYAGAAGGYIDALGYPFCRGRLFNYLERDQGQYNDTCQVFWATGACMMIRSDVYHRLGGFDETFFAHMEEIDLCWKIQRSGHRVFYCGQSTVYHLGAGTLSQSNPRKTYYNFQNGLRLIYKNLPAIELIYKLPLRIFLDYVAALKFIAQGGLRDGVAVVRAHIDFLRTLRSTHRQRKSMKARHPFTREKIYPGLIVIDYYIFRRKLFSSIIPDRTSS
jgi:GT2 family glycosyltransferase